MKVQGKFKMQAHSTNGVVMDIAAFKVSYSTVSDSDATTLQAEKARSASIGAIDESSDERQFKMQTHHSPRGVVMDIEKLQPSKLASPLELT